MKDEPTPKSTYVCVLTGRGMAAIATVALVGPEAAAILGRLFSKSPPPRGRSAYGLIRDDQTVLDSVVTACEGDDRYLIHCHGNPLLIERIVRLCRQCGAVSQWPQDYLLEQLLAESKTLIEAEARLEMTRTVTLEGVRLLTGQISDGLAAWTRAWIDCKSIDINHLHQQCRTVLQHSRIAEHLLKGVKIALVGPPNSGKSTLLNRLAQETAALVSDAAGTTRDWVSTTCRIGPLKAEIMDTAGIDAMLAAGSEVDQAAQQTAIEILKNCDLILCLREYTQPKPDIPLPPKVPVLCVLTKIDLAPDPTRVAAPPAVAVSAVTDIGIQDLCNAVVTALGTDILHPTSPVVFTPRQRDLIEKLAESTTELQAQKHLEELWG